MKISAIETIRIDEFPNLLWVHVCTDDGIVGLGETFYGPGAAEAHIHETIAPIILTKTHYLFLNIILNLLVMLVLAERVQSNVGAQL